MIVDQSQIIEEVQTKQRSLNQILLNYQNRQ